MIAAMMFMTMCTAQGCADYKAAEFYLADAGVSICEHIAAQANHAVEKGDPTHFHCIVVKK